jgi:hypothetical protein
MTEPPPSTDGFSPENDETKSKTPMYSLIWTDETIIIIEASGPQQS